MTITFLLVTNSEPGEEILNVFCDTYNLTNLITVPTCFKNLLKPSFINLMLTNRAGQFQDNLTIETGISDHHKNSFQL